MGAGISAPVTENINNLHSQLMSHAGADYDIATTTTLSYSQFVAYITELNKICARYHDAQNCVLVFAVKKGTDATLFWKATVRVACVKLNAERNQVESHRLLNIRQFLQVFRRISYECNVDAVQASPSEQGATANPPPSVPPTLAASMVLEEASKGGESQAPPSSSKGEECLMEECIICLERKSDVILPCCHAFCTPCIEQWLEYCGSPLPENDLDDDDLSGKSCPVCRESVESAEEGWVISEAPDRGEVDQEIRKALISYATTSSGGNRAPTFTSRES
ncbi:UNVERIFIED_CONTAM: hypothetical protein GTU68_024025 [Idotea baltica]|nr:hypothetical protein [Idotea baltica]